MSWASFFSGLIGALVGVIATHFLAVRKDIVARRQELIVKNLIAAYEAFDASPLLDPKDEALAVERAVANIQLFGDEALVKLTKAFCDDLASKGQANIIELMKEIRAQVRRELQLEPLGSDFSILRFHELRAANERQK